MKKGEYLRSCDRERNWNPSRQPCKATKDTVGVSEKRFREHISYLVSFLGGLDVE